MGEAVWTCQPKDVEGDLTVGKKFVLSCEGSPSPLKREGLRIDNPDPLKYALRILDVKSLTDTHAELLVTSWTAGDLKMQKAVLTDGTTAVNLGELDLTVASVIKPETNPEKTPAPPWGVVSLAWPMYVWLACFAVAGVVAMVIALVARKMINRKRFLSEISKNAPALSPYDQFNKDLRKVTREIPSGDIWGPEASRSFFKSLDQMFRWFVARKLMIPVLHVSAVQMAREITNANPEFSKKYKADRRELILLLRELRKASEAKTASSIQDAHQLADLARKLVDRLNVERKK